MRPSLTRLDHDAAPHWLINRTPDDRMPLGAAGAVILGLSVAGWMVVYQAARLVATLVG